MGQRGESTIRILISILIGTWTRCPSGDSALIHFPSEFNFKKPYPGGHNQEQPPPMPSRNESVWWWLYSEAHRGWWWWWWCWVTGPWYALEQRQGRRTNLHFVKYAKRCSSIHFMASSDRLAPDELKPQAIQSTTTSGSLIIASDRVLVTCLARNKDTTKRPPLEVGLNNLRGFRLITIYSPSPSTRGQDKTRQQK